jgi:hypothetical protein
VPCSRTIGDLLKYMVSVADLHAQNIWRGESGRELPSRTSGGLGRILYAEKHGNRTAASRCTRAPPEQDFLCAQDKERTARSARGPRTRTESREVYGSSVGREEGRFCIEAASISKQKYPRRFPIYSPQAMQCAPISAPVTAPRHLPLQQISGRPGRLFPFIVLAGAHRETATVQATPSPLTRLRNRCKCVGADRFDAPDGTVD